MMDRSCQPICRFAVLLAAFCCAPLVASPPGYVLLRNGNVLRGEAKQDGAFISVEEANVAAIRLPQADVLCWAPSLTDLYAYRVEHRKPHSLTARFDDLRWCIKQGLLDVAETELAQLQRLAPSDRRIVSMTALLHSARQRTQPDSHPHDLNPQDRGDLATSEIPAAGRERRPNLLGSFEAADDMAALPRHLMITYTKRIQPLLINRCGQAGCHGGASPAVWQLEHFGSTFRLPANYTRRNLGNVLQWIKHDQPLASPLLVRAEQAHGGIDAAPLGLGDDELRQGLREWITAMTHRHENSAGGALATNPSRAPLLASAAPNEDAMPADSNGSEATSKPTRLPPVDDPFDPADFNRIYHHQ